MTKKYAVDLVIQTTRQRGSKLKLIRNFEFSTFPRRPFSNISPYSMNINITTQYFSEIQSIRRK